MEYSELAQGMQAPDFEAEISDGRKIRLSEILSDGKGVILYFYPRDNTPGCTYQSCDFRNNFEIFQENGWNVFGISSDSANSHEKFIQKYNLPFDLIVDDDSNLHKKFGTWREKKFRGNTYMGTLRSTFVIDSDGSIRWASYGVKAKKNVEEIMEILGLEGFNGQEET